MRLRQRAVVNRTGSVRSFQRRNWHDQDASCPTVAPRRGRLSGSNRRRSNRRRRGRGWRLGRGRLGNGCARRCAHGRILGCVSRSPGCRIQSLKALLGLSCASRVTTFRKGCVSPGGGTPNQGSPGHRHRVDAAGAKGQGALFPRGAIRCTLVRELRLHASRLGARHFGIRAGGRRLGACASDFASGASQVQGRSFQ